MHAARRGYPRRAAGTRCARSRVAATLRQPAEKSVQVGIIVFVDTHPLAVEHPGTVPGTCSRPGGREQCGPAQLGPAFEGEQVVQKRHGRPCPACLQPLLQPDQSAPGAGRSQNAGKDARRETRAGAHTARPASPHPGRRRGCGRVRGPVNPAAPEHQHQGLEPHEKFGLQLRRHIQAEVVHRKRMAASQVDPLLLFEKGGERVQPGDEPLPVAAARYPRTGGRNTCAAVVPSATSGA